VPALCRPRLFLECRRAWRHRDSSPAVRLDNGSFAQRVTHRFEGGPVGAEDLIQRFGEVLHEVKAVGHLGGLRGASTGTIAIPFHAISGDHGDTGMLP
jgi:hypothetical protein